MIQQGLRRASGACLYAWSRALYRSDAGTCACSAGVQRQQDRHSRQFHLSAALQKTDVVVPSMGDSITEGSIAAMLKVTNDTVDEDEVIAQIDTDKVTIDVRAPLRGVLRAVLVKQEDSVTVGQVIAVLDEAVADAAQQAAPEPAAHSVKATPVSYEELMDAASEKSDSAMHGRKAHIMFPPRKTVDGYTISAMPAIDQETYRQRGMAAKSAGANAASKEGTVSSLASAQPSNSAHVSIRLEPRTPMADLEMESIMLGGAIDTPERTKDNVSRMPHSV